MLHGIRSVNPCCTNASLQARAAACGLVRFMPGYWHRSWLGPVFSTSDVELARCAGIDAAVRMAPRRGACMRAMHSSPDTWHRPCNMCLVANPPVFPVSQILRMCARVRMRATACNAWRHAKPCMHECILHAFCHLLLLQAARPCCCWAPRASICYGCMRAVACRHMASRPLGGAVAWPRNGLPPAPNRTACVASLRQQRAVGIFLFSPAVPCRS